MQVSELISLAKWYRINIVERGIESAYQNLSQKLNNNASSSQKTPFEDEKNILIELLNSVSVRELTLESVDFLKEKKILGLIGDFGANNVEDILFRNSIDIASAAQHFKEIVQIIGTATAFFTNIEDTIAESFKETEDEIHDDETMIRVYFRDASSITNVSELKKYAALWYDVARGVTLAIDAKPEDVRVLSAEKGSIIINLVAITSIARILSGIILKILEITQKILEIKEQKINIEKLKIEKELIQKELDSAIKKERDEGAAEICNYFVQELKIKKDGEKTQALKKSITKLIDFIEKGGSVDFVCKQNVDDDESKETERLRETTDKMLEDVERIRELEGKLLLLEEKIQNPEQN